MIRRALALFLLLPVVGAEPLLACARPAEHGCRDHVCMCAQACAPRRGAGKGCHGAEPSGPGMRGACNHDQPSAPPSASPALLPAPALTGVGVASAPAVVEVAGVLTEGFLRIDGPPPRTL